MSPPIQHPPYGGPGQARAPKFALEDTVYVLAVPKSANTVRSHDTPLTASLPSKNTSTKPTTKSYHKTSQLQSVDEYVQNTVWKITSIDPSPSSSAEHMYHLQPTNSVRVTMPESRLLATRFLPGDIVTKDKLLYQVQEVDFARNKEGNVALRYLVRDELNVEKSLDDDVAVQRGDEEQWFPLRE